jgi:hypothetical protein
MSTNASWTIKKSDFYCPAGGDFYICFGSWVEFIGCCASDPCTDGLGICPDGHLRTTSHNDTESWGSSTVSWKCFSTTPSTKEYSCGTSGALFFGCCDTDPCGKGLCPKDDLQAAIILSRSFSDTAGINYSFIWEPSPLVFKSSNADGNGIRGLRGGIGPGRVACIFTGILLVALLLLGMLGRIWYALLRAIE